MTPQKKKERLIELRSQGLSFDSIAKELGIAKQTAITWSRELKIELQNAEAIQRDALIQKLQINKEQRLTLFANLQKRLSAELEARSLSELSAKELCEMLLKTAKTLREEQVPIEFSAEESALSLNLAKIATWSV